MAIICAGTAGWNQQEMNVLAGKLLGYYSEHMNAQLEKAQQAEQVLEKLKEIIEKVRKGTQSIADENEMKQDNRDQWTMGQNQLCLDLQVAVRELEKEVAQK